MTIKSATIRMPQKRSYGARVPRRGPAFRPNLGVFQSSLKGVVTFLILALFLGLSLFTSYKVKNVAADISQLEQRYASVEGENGQLKAQLAQMASKSTLAKLGKRLGLRPPAQDQIVTLPE
ncbi:MAG: hypothetical protein GXO58_06645 [Thermodesulfobacteria bacterium]|nr:hypothetical protein [Thermodesulfobacteriota bacterium]